MIFLNFFSPASISAALDHSYNVTVVHSEGDARQRILWLVMDAIDGSQSTSNFVPIFQDDPSRNGKSYTEEISSQIPIEEIQSVSIFSDTVEHIGFGRIGGPRNTTFYISQIEFEPTYDNHPNYKKVFYAGLSHIEPPMKHQLWYTLTKSIFAKIPSK